jgi:hypothetical protein
MKSVVVRGLQPVSVFRRILLRSENLHQGSPRWSRSSVILASLLG